MIGHDRALELAAASIDFGLSSTDDAALAEHLEGCEACRTTVILLRQDAAALRSLHAVDAPAGLRERVMEAADAGSALAEPTSPTPRRATILRFPTRIPPVAAVAAAAVMVLAVIGGTLFWRPAAPPDGVAVIDPSDRPTPVGTGNVPGSTGSPSSGPSDDLVTPQPQLALITPDHGRGGVVPVDATFELAALGGRSAPELAQHLTVQPQIELTTTVEPDGRVSLTPKEPLTPGVVYRFSVTAPDGVTSDSWAFQAAQPLRIVSTVPGTDETDIPVDTGIEVTFDQDGVVGAEEHFSIQPNVAGRFERHGRVLSFVPERPLRAATIYTVTVTGGVTVESTGEALERDVRFQFETAATGETSSPANFFRFSNDLFESATRDRPFVALWWFADDPDEGRASNPATARLDVYRFPDRQEAMKSFQALRQIAWWSRWNANETVPTAGLTRVARVDARLRDDNGTLWTTLPERLRAGWYLVEHPDAHHPVQTILQVTDVAVYLAVSDRNSVVWANDVSTGRPLRGATVETRGAGIGRTDASGLLVAPTPGSWSPDTMEGCVESCTPLMTVTAAQGSAFVPVTGGAGPDGKDQTFDWFGGDADPRYWKLFDTDRLRYRRTDTINAWGMVRERESGAVPDNVEMRLILDGEATAAPITVARATTRPTGAFTASLPLKDAPEGSYSLELVVDGRVVGSRYLTVERILKPAYRVDVTTGRRVYVVGDRIRVKASAHFFEGTSVPGVPIRFEGQVEGRATTDASGTATVRGVATWDSEESREGPRIAEVIARPARAEEGDGQSVSRDFVIFPSHWLVAGEASVRGNRVRITGSANELDRDRVEREVSTGTGYWDIDPRGKPLRGRTVRARVVEEIPVRTRIGTSYDFVEKRAVPVYTYSTRDRLVSTVRMRTGADGRFSTNVRIRSTRHDYRVELEITDPDGLRSSASLYALGASEADREDRTPVLRSTVRPRGDDEDQTVVGVGERVDMTMFEPDATAEARRDRHLFVAAQGGIREATVTASDRYAVRFPDWGPPNVSYRAVRFTGAGYVASAPYEAMFRSSDRAMSVTVVPDRKTYRPGQVAKLAVTTLDAQGRPMAATVIIRGVDEKLFFIGAAADVDSLDALYTPVAAGIVATYATHAGPRSRSQGADTGGGGTDGEVNDTILFQAVDTDGSGRASVAMPLPDDLTSWHLSATAIGGGLEAGGTTRLVPVALPFFVDTSMAPEYLAADRPSIQIRGFGDGLAADSRVRFSVDSETLGLHERGLTAKAFQAVTVALPKLTVGRHRITITGQTGTGSSLQRHVLTRSIDVVASRLTRTRTTYSEPTGSTGVDGEGDVSAVVVTDAGRGRLLSALYELADVRSGRLEVALAHDVAGEMLSERFGDDRYVRESGFRGSVYQREDGGIALIPYGSSDLDVTVMAALAAPERFNAASLRDHLRSVDLSASETRERRNVALAGRAGTGEPVLPAIRAALAGSDLTVRERLLLGIGAARLGDTETARRVAGELAAAFGEGISTAARLRVGSGNLDDTTASAFMAMLLAAYGDPAAARYWTYVSSQPNDEAVYALHGIAYTRWIIDRLPGTTARFAYVLDGRRTEVDLASGDSFRLLLTRALRATFAIEPLQGSIGVTTTWDEPIAADAIAPDPDIRITRSVRPAGTIGQASLVVVDLVVRFGAHAPVGCHSVVDLAPSGLVPISMLRGFVDPETGEEATSDVTYPDSQAGQRISFCADHETRRSTASLRYVARVISIGTYDWEPALVESRTAADRAAVVPATTIRIR